MNSLIEVIGIDPDDLEWRDLALCRGMGDTRDGINEFFETYEESSNFAIVMDEVCLSCPVTKQCLAFGIENKENGLWGATYLSSGKPDASRNAHKTPAVWKKIEKRIRDSSTI